MKAVRYDDYGGPENARLVDVPAPRPGRGEVLIKLAASSINPADWKVGKGYLRGMMGTPLPPFVAGMDFSGVVTELGSGATKFAVGDRVFGATELSQLSAFAEMLAVPETLVAKAPASIPLAHAAAITIAGETAWYVDFLPDHGNITRGKSVLIHGASGGTGIFAAQFARWKGAQVIATASSRNVEFVRSLGVDDVIDYQTTNFESTVRDVDVVLDLVGGDVQERSLPLIKKGGVLSSIVSVPDAALTARYGVKGTYMVHPRESEPLVEIARLIDDGHVKVIVSEEYPLAETAKALARSRGGHVRGKILINIGG